MISRRRLWRGLSSVAAGLAFPLGGWWLGASQRLFDRSRLRHGLAIVLPGVEGWGPLNWSIARGLADGGFPGAIYIHDWTTGFWPLFALHLRASRRNRDQAEAIAHLIRAYQAAYPGRPVYLVGHSGGGAVAVWVLEALPRGQPIRAAVLLGPALSPGYDLRQALRRVETVLWSFWSPCDLIFLALGTLLAGTADGHHSVCAGCCGFTLSGQGELYRRRLRQRRYTLGMLGQFHWGGHLTWANRVFVEEEIAPLLGTDPRVATPPTAAFVGGRKAAVTGAWAE